MKSYCGNLSFGLIAGSSILVAFIFIAGTLLGAFDISENPMAENMFEAGLFFYILFGLGFLFSLLQSVGVFDTYHIFKDTGGNRYAKKSEDVTDMMMGHLIMPFLTKFLIRPLIYAAVIYYALYILLSIALSVLPFVVILLTLLGLILFLIKLWKFTRKSTVSGDSVISQMGVVGSSLIGISLLIAGYISQYLYSISDVWRVLRMWSFGGFYQINTMLDERFDLTDPFMAESIMNRIPNLFLVFIIVGAFILAYGYPKFKTFFYLLAIPFCIIIARNIIFNDYTGLQLEFGKSQIVNMVCHVAIRLGFCYLILQLCDKMGRNLKMFMWGLLIIWLSVWFLFQLSQFAHYFADNYSGLELWIAQMPEYLELIALPLVVLQGGIMLVVVSLFFRHLKKNDYTGNGALVAKLFFLTLMLNFIVWASGDLTIHALGNFIITTLTIIAFVKFGKFLQEEEASGIKTQKLE